LPNLNPRKWLSALLPVSTQTRNVKRARFILVAAFLLAAVFLTLALRGLDWSRFFQTLRNARYAWLPVVFVWGSLSYFIRAVRWRVLIQSEQPVRLQGVFWANMAGYLGNAVLPARAGELARAAYLGAQTRISVSFILATGLAERLVDLVALIIIGSLALATSGLASLELQKALTVMAGVGTFGLVAMLLLPHFGGLIEKLITVLPGISESMKTRLGGLLHQFLHGLQALLDIRRATSFGLLTMLIWLMDGLGTVFAGFVLRVPITLLQAFVLLAGLGLSSALPSTPGYVGIYQFVAVLVLVPFGIARADALAYILFAQVSGFLIVAVWGVVALWRVSAAQKRLN
jgi:uncharacterized protein (TIRG00374 family)